MDTKVKWFCSVCVKSIRAKDRKRHEGTSTHKKLLASSQKIDSAMAGEGCTHHSAPETDSGGSVLPCGLEAS